MAEQYLTPEQHRAMLKQRGRQNRSTKPILMVIAAIVIAALGFIGGVQYQKGHQKTSTSSAASQNGQPGFGTGGRGFGGQRPTFGQVTAISASSITVQAQDGTSTTLAITSATAISDSGQTVTASDISVGETVAVVANSTDKTQASRILVNPSFGGPGASGNSTQSTTN